MPAASEPPPLATNLGIVDGSVVVFPAAGPWVAWPTRTSGMPTDVTDHAVRALALPLGLVDNKVCALNDTWTALRLIGRKDRRAGATPVP